MAKNDQYHPDYMKLYPGIEDRPDVLRVLKKSDRKMEYMEVDIKTETFVHDVENQKAWFKPCREDSCDRLAEENNVQFASNEDSTESRALRRIQIREMEIALCKLDPDEYALVSALYFENLGERKYAKMIGISQKGVNKRHHKVLEKLRLIMENEKK